MFFFKISKISESTYLYRKASGGCFCNVLKARAVLKAEQKQKKNKQKFFETCKVKVNNAMPYENCKSTGHDNLT